MSTRFKEKVQRAVGEQITLGRNTFEWNGKGYASVGGQVVEGIASND